MLKELKKLGFFGVFVWLLVANGLVVIFYGEYQERKTSEKSFYKAAIVVVYCTGNIIGTGVAITAAIILIMKNIMKARAKRIARKIFEEPNEYDEVRGRLKWTTLQIKIQRIIQWRRPPLDVK